MIGRNFPSATVQSAEAVYKGKRRSILMARIRTDSTDAVDLLNAYASPFSSDLLELR
jgi:hypothetical protein